MNLTPAERDVLFSDDGDGEQPFFTDLEWHVHELTADLPPPDAADTDLSDEDSLEDLIAEWKRETGYPTEHDESRSRRDVSLPNS